MENSTRNVLMKNLRENTKKGDSYWDNNASVISYKTGIPTLDYHLGYTVSVFDDDDKLIDNYNNVGIPAGCFITGIGKPSTAKTTTFSQIGSNIVRPFANGSVIHYDLEQASNYSRIRVLSRFKMSDIKAGKYVLRQEKNSISDIKQSLMELYLEKHNNPDLYMYDTGRKNEFGEEIKLLEPTVVIIDSIASLVTDLNENVKDDLKKMKEVSSQPDKMRLAGEISRFVTEILPYLRAGNIIIMAINHIKTSPQGLVKSASEILYLKQDEALPGGKAPQYYAHILLKFVAIGSDKFTMVDDGFDGFGIRAEIIKSRVNQAGQSVYLIYDKLYGIDSIRTTIAYAKELGLVGGNKNGMYFADHKDLKFIPADIRKEFKEKKELYTVMYDTVIPCLEGRLSCLTSDELNDDNTIDEPDEEEYMY